MRNKDFSNYSDIRVVELNQYEKDFNFKWDYFIIQKDADIVSNIEEYLINKFGTQDSPYQMIINGGQNWNDIKHFVLNNKGNPKFRGVSGSEIKEYLDSQKRMNINLSNFVGSMIPKEEVGLKSFIGSMRPREEADLEFFVNNMLP